MKRSRCREILMNCIYQMNIKNEYDMSAVNSYINVVKSTEDIKGGYAYISRNLDSFLENREYIDALIEKSLKNWKPERISSVDLALIRMCITEVLYDYEVPYKVSINETLNLAKKFSDGEDGESVKFINGLMSNIIEIGGIK